ncbi:MAG: hypothetical protein LBL48_10785 [Azoarcus sp.]|jgi:hypothetical protein|nr:hypothetical protein [Azoarcus sp.]
MNSRRARTARLTRGPWHPSRLKGFRAGASMPMAAFVYLASVLSMAVIAFFIGIHSGLMLPLETMPTMRYFSLVAVSVILLTSGVVLLVIGTRKRKVYLYRNGEVLLVIGLILWTFVGLWDIASNG